MPRPLRSLHGFSRRDAVRLVIFGALLIGSLTALLSLDILPGGFRGQVGDEASQDVIAPRALTYVSERETEAARTEARRLVAPQYDYSADRAQSSSERQSAAFDAAMGPVDSAFGAILTDEARDAALAEALPELTPTSLETLQGLTPAEWTSFRSEMARVLQTAQREEVRDTQLNEARAALEMRVSTRFTAAGRQLAGEILSPLLVANSTYDAEKTRIAQDAAAAAVQEEVHVIRNGQIIVRDGEIVTQAVYEQMERLGLLDPTIDLLTAGGWGVLSSLLVALVLGWVWRFRPEVWHRTNSLLLLGLVLVLAAVALKVTGDRPLLPYLVPVAAVGILLAVLLDSGTALVAMAFLGIVAGAVTGTVELGAYAFLGGMAGIVVVRRGERLGYFIQAAAAVSLANVAVVTAFTLIGERDLTGVVQLWGAAVASAAASAVAAVGSFAVLGNLFGITTSFQMLELANPSQPLLRRLLLETPGTYHHSLTVGNLGERAAEAIGADPLITRVAAYYHDIGKLANPLAFIENQGQAQNPHDELSPEASAQVLKSHVTDGIDLGYRYKLPRPIIAYIPQHHGTALMSFFYAKAKEQAVEAAGATPGTPQAKAAEATVDAARFRHAGPKPQSKEAAILMLADSVEASVRSLTSQDEPAIRAMVDRIIRERLEDGQLDECDVTLGDVDRIREAFVSQLLGMYHRRIEYPQNKIVEIESRRAASGRGG